MDVKNFSALMALVALTLMFLGVVVDLSDIVGIFTAVLIAFFPIMIVLLIIEFISNAFGFSLIKKILDVF